MVLGSTSSFLSIREYSTFYKQKSILPTYKFDVFLDFDKYALNNATYLATNPLTYLPFIQPFHILSVDIPFASFSRGDGLNMGTIQYTYPVLAKEQALDIKITMEEDQSGTIAGFIQEMQESVIRKGYHVAPSKSRLGDIYINVDNQQDGTVSGYIAKDVFFLGASPITPSYDSGDSVKYDITFGTDYMAYNDAPDMFNVSTRRTNIFSSPRSMFG